ncbi:hypothetical protein CC80DRAFT_192941 [Byssothecium circinans]|uniref:Uncharacterized protein n=1 Tax=Byssothecium circinans TaxID=147558 RepID=A0A6A5TJ57_9PLEO|nr:hypothetical protein CC80DRAFT_192941 [Byssothecium circinans]
MTIDDCPSGYNTQLTYHVLHVHVRQAQKHVSRVRSPYLALRYMHNVHTIYLQYGKSRRCLKLAELFKRCPCSLVQPPLSTRQQTKLLEYRKDLIKQQALHASAVPLIHVCVCDLPTANHPSSHLSTSIHFPMQRHGKHPPSQQPPLYHGSIARWQNLNRSTLNVHRSPMCNQHPIQFP